MTRHVHRFRSPIEALVLIIDRSRDTGLAQDRVQSFLWNITQQGNTFVPGKESKRGRAKRVKKTIQAVDHQFPNPHVAHQQGHGAEMPVVSGVNTTEHQCAVHNGTTANLALPLFQRPSSVDILKQQVLIHSCPPEFLMNGRLPVTKWSANLARQDWRIGHQNVDQGKCRRIAVNG